MRVFKRNGFPIPSGMDAITIGTWIFMRTNAPDNVLPHEEVHVQQFKDDWLFPIKYLLSSKYRYEKEIEAYAVAMKHGLPLDTAVYYLLNYYHAGKSERQIRRDLNRTC